MKLSTILNGLLLALGVQLTHAADFTQKFQWKEEGRSVSAWVDPDYRAEVVAGSKSRSVTARQLEAAGSSGPLRLYKVQASQRRDVAADTALLPVVRSAPSSSAPYLVPAGGVLVSTSDEAALRAWLDQRGLTLRAAGVSGFWLVPSSANEEALQLASQLSQLPGVSTATPNWRRPLQKR